MDRGAEFESGRAAEFADTPTNLGDPHVSLAAAQHGTTREGGSPVSHGCSWVGWLLETSTAKVGRRFAYVCLLALGLFVVPPAATATASPNVTLDASAAIEGPPYVLTPTPTGPKASLTWIPASPVVGEPVSLVSTSLGGSSAIVSYAWDPTGSGAFLAGGPVFATSFASPGPHAVRLLVTDASGLTAVAGATINVKPARAALMQPFPIVRIAGSVTPHGATIRLLSVLAPPGARVTVRCRGRHCAVRGQSRVVGLTAASEKTGMSLINLHAFERQMRAGTLLQIVVTRGSDIGKYTSFLIRAGHLPVRDDACVEPTSPRPMACPTS